MSTDPTAPTVPGGRRTRLVLTVVTLVCVGGLAAAGAILAASVDRTPPGSALPPVAYSAEPTLPPGLQPGEDLSYGAVDIETMTWLTDLQTALSGDPGFGTVALSPDRGTVTITWYGDPGATLQEQIDAAPDGITVVVQPADFPPAELQELVRQVMTPDLLPGVRVTMGGVENDGSGLLLWIEELPPGRTLDEVAEQLADALDRPDVPITVEVGQVTPASA